MINSIKRILLKKIYQSQYKNGHFYSPVPNLQEIRNSEKEIFRDASNDVIPGLDLNIKLQKDTLSNIVPLIKEIDLFPHKQPGNRYYGKNGFF